jgi:hypothetical protein
MTTLDKSTTDAISLKKQEIDAQEAVEFTNRKRYKQFLLSKESDFEFEVHELVNPKGEVGYITIFHKEIDGKKFVKTVGEGIDKDLHTKDWFELLPENNL